MNPSQSTSGFSLSIQDMISYLQGRFSDQEHQRIEAIIQNNPLYQEALKELKDILQQEKGQEEALMYLESLMGKEIDSMALKVKGELPLENGHLAQVKKFSKPLIWKAAAIILLLSIIGITVYSLIIPPKEVRLAKAFLQHYDDPLPQLGDIEDLALRYYAERKYSEAIPLFEELLARSGREKEGQTNRFKMFFGVSLLHEGRAPESVSHFLEVIEHNNNIYISSAKWYLSLAYLIQENKSDARKWLNKLISSPQKDRSTLNYQTKAKNLLAKLT